MTINVIKRNGKLEDLDLEKLHKVVFYACNNITGVSASEVEIKSNIQLYDGIKTSEIQEILIKSAADLISEETPGYQYVGGRLINYHLRKMVYEQFDPWHLKKIINRNIELGMYDPNFVKWYSEDELDELDGYIRHDRDETLTYAGMEQWRGKYLVKNRVTNEIYETPQVAYMCIAATLFSNYPKDTRLKWIKDYYDAISTYSISLPTPVMSGVRTTQKQYSSCVLIETDDSLDSLNATTSSIVKYVSQKAGIGVGAGRIRALGSPIRNGDAYHTGVIPFLKMFQSATRSCSQGGVRSGSTTVYYPIWHLEVEDLLVLKNNKGTEDNRARHMDYGVQFNKVMYERLINNENITLFSPNDVPEVYEAFFADQDKFRELYESAENNVNIRKKTIKAVEIFSKFMEERKTTGRIYLQNVDNANIHSSFDVEKAPIRQSNLCAEITLPTKPLNGMYDGPLHCHVEIPKARLGEFEKYQKENVFLAPPNDSGLYEIAGYAENNDEYAYRKAMIADPAGSEIALCTLSAINWGKIKNPDDFKKPCELAVRGLDSLLNHQSYPIPAAENATRGRRSLGIGIINLAYWMAKNNMTYTEPNLEIIDEYAEAWSYWLIKASADLAREKGACLWNDHTKYSKGILPIDTYKKDVDELVKHKERMPWDELRQQLKKHGIRNSTLMALMPSETSSQLANATNGIEPPRSYVSVKQSKDGILKQVVPGYPRLQNKYELLWDQKSPEGYIKLTAILQKYIDQGISINTSYNPAFFEDEKIPMSVMLKHLIMCYRYGHKQLYYCNINDGSTDELKEYPISDSSIISEDEECESCVI